MTKSKFRTITIAALSLLLTLLLSLAAGMIMPRASASAEEYTPTNIFSTGTNTSVSNTEEDGTDYLSFTHAGNGASAYFRRDLALKWFASDEGASYLSLTVAFPEIAFSEYTISFESAEENISEEELSENSVLFENGEAGTTAAVINASGEKGEAVAVDLSGDVVLTIDEEDCAYGEFSVYVNGTKIGTFTNIGGYFMEYLSSASDTPRTPITFESTTLSGESQVVLVKELNGQSFALNENGKVVDDTAPVLVVNSDVYPFTLGTKFSLDYEAIDVCDSTVTVSREYCMARFTESGDYRIPADDDYKTLTTSTWFMPSDDAGEEEVQYVSIRFTLDDGRDNAEETEAPVYLVWYAAEGASVTFGAGEDTLGYILVDRADKGPVYNGLTATATTEDGRPSGENVKDADSEDVNGNGDSEEVLLDVLAAQYQSAVDRAAENASAGDGAYFYLPSLRSLISSDSSDYRDLTFNIYYYSQSQTSDDTASSATSLAYNRLRFEIGEPGRYVFRVLASDGSGNGMMYYLDGKLVTVTSSNIWEIEEIPEFSFTVGYDGARITDPEEQELGYRDTTYDAEDFEIIAVSGYETEYELYRIDENSLPSELQGTSYSSLVANAKEYFDGDWAQYLIRIDPFNSEIDEDDALWDRTDNRYEWQPDDLTFVPNEAGYYVIKLTVTEPSMPGYSVSAYQVIDVRNPIDTLPDATYWLENNVAAVVLFCISGVLLIALVALFVIKPRQSVDEVDVKSLKGSKKSKTDEEKKD